MKQDEQQFLIYLDKHLWTAADKLRANGSGEPPESICRRLRLTRELLDPFPDRMQESEIGQIP
ncbi:MAG: hypothetical protein M0036_11015 [Desulfobacteraceae bacterium]|nr:hypothetical protein [Desulfobacteraceae bacterium]